MATPTKLTMYSISPEDPKQRTKKAVFELKDGKVEMEYFGANKESNKAEMVKYGLYNAKEGKSFFPKDGEKFMRLLPDAFPRASFVAIEEG